MRIAWNVSTANTTSVAPAIARQIFHGTPCTNALLAALPSDPATPSNAAKPISNPNRIMLRNGGGIFTQ